MHVILWEFQARAGREGEFERAYGPEGEWARFFESGEGYLWTELLADPAVPARYVTIDRWTSLAAYDSFRAQHAMEYDELDKHLTSLTERETPLGWFNTVTRG